uniref:FBD domain-containing protein n=1 Tax=Leersia perrieri TaxID=77586 RepID=A0A0D9W0R3_9ORYZ
MDKNDGVEYEFPRFVKLETMSLTLAGATLQIPPATVFRSLTDLFLSNLRVENGNGQLLGRLLSPLISDQPLELQLESSELLELTLEGIRKDCLISLEINAPRLRVLDMKRLYLDSLAISTPRLEEFKLHGMTMMTRLNVGDMPWVRTLNRISIWSRGHYSHVRNHIHFLRCCKFLKFLEVKLMILSQGGVYKDGEVDLRKDIPQLPHVTSLSITICPIFPCDLTTPVACLLKQCRFLKHLQVDMRLLSQSYDRALESTGNQSQTSHDTISLEDLLEINIIGIRG